MAGRLRQSKPGKPGIARRRAGRGFFYLDADGIRITDPETLARIKGLVIPPAWTDVWICPWPNGHIQVLGTDDAGRRQYLYHPLWRDKQDKEKFLRALDFGARLPRIRRAVARHLIADDDPRLRCLAAAVRLIDRASLRTGAEEYAEANGSFGVTTLQRQHVQVRGNSVDLEFPGKSGKPWSRTVKDPALARFLSSLPAGDPESVLLNCPDAPEGPSGISAVALNAYIARISGGAFTGKDFRTWQGTAAAARALAELAAHGAAGQKAVTQAMEQVAEFLNNTPAIASSSYVDPRVVQLFLKGRIASLNGSMDSAAVRLLKN